MLPPLLLQNRLLLRVLLTTDAVNGSACEAIYAGTFTLAGRGMVLEITPEMIDQIVANFETLEEAGRIPISVNHNTDGATLETACAVGWVVRLFKKAEGGRISLMMEPHWLEDALGAISAGQFRFLSIGLIFQDTNPLSGENIGPHLIEVSLTNTPAIPGLEPITLTALNSPEKLALTVERIRSRRIDLGLAVASLMDRVHIVITSFYRRFPDTQDGVWCVEDVMEDFLIARRSTSQGAAAWQIGYQIGPDGIVSFSSLEEWIVVEQIWQPVETQAGREVSLPIAFPASKKSISANLPQYMPSPGRASKDALPAKEPKTMTDEQLRTLLGLAADADIGMALTALAALPQQVQDLQVQVETLAAKNKELEAAKAALAQKDTEVFRLTTQTTAFGQEIEKLSAQVKTLTTEKATRECETRLSRALRERKVLPAELDAEEGFLRKLAADQPEIFDKIVAARPAYDGRLFVELAAGAEEPPDGKIDEEEFWLLVRTKRAADSTLSQSKARAVVLAEHPEYRTMFTQAG